MAGESELSIDEKRQLAYDFLTKRGFTERDALKVVLLAWPESDPPDNDPQN
jgi:hypothetical protein